MSFGIDRESIPNLHCLHDEKNCQNRKIEQQGSHPDWRVGTTSVRTELCVKMRCIKEWGQNNMSMLCNDRKSFHPSIT